MRIYHIICIYMPYSRYWSIFKIYVSTIFKYLINEGENLMRDKNLSLNQIFAAHFYSLSTELWNSNKWNSVLYAFSNFHSHLNGNFKLFLTFNGGVIKQNDLFHFPFSNKTINWNSWTSHYTHIWLKKNTAFCKTG